MQSIIIVEISGAEFCNEISKNLLKYKSMGNELTKEGRGIVQLSFFFLFSVLHRNKHLSIDNKV